MVMKNQEQPFSLTLENGGIIRINDGRLGFEANFSDLVLADKEEDTEKTINLAPTERIVLKGAATCRYAGTYDIGLKEVSFRDPFGIIEVKLPVPEPYRVTVMPRITDIADNVLDFENLKNSSRLKSVLLKEPTPGNELRPYIYGDTIRNIHWKASAAAGELISRIPEPLDLKKITMVLIAENDVPDRNDHDFIKRRDYFLEFAVSAAYYHAVKGESIQIIYPRGEIRDRQVASLDGFSEFYNDISRGPFYNGEGDYNRLKDLSESRLKNELDSIIITVRESEYGTEDFLDVRISG